MCAVYTFSCYFNLFNLLFLSLIRHGKEEATAEPGHEAHFGAIHNPKFANLLQFHPRVQDAHVTF